MQANDMQFKLALFFINQYADSIFDKHDGNRSGFLDVREIYPAICEIYQINNKYPPSYPQCLMIMKDFDGDGNGLIDKKEFRNILKALSNI